MRVERRFGDFKDKTTGEKVDFDFTLLHVWDGSSLIEVRLPKGVDERDLGCSVDDDIELSVSVPKGTKVQLNDGSSILV